MKQVLVDIPIPGFGDVPIFGFGMMLFLSFVACTWLLSRRARAEGMPAERVQDVALWIFVAGIVGARFTYLITEDRPLSEWYRIWDGGLVFYGSILGGALGALLTYQFILKKHQIALGNLADMLAPAIALGICLGRLGCFLNGCCYGHVCSTHGPAVHFPLASPPRTELVEKGWQTPAGFTMIAASEGDERTVGAVEASSPASAAGLRPGDVIIQAGPQEIRNYAALFSYLTRDWPRGKNELELTVQRDEKTMALPPFAPRTVGLHPTQLYSSIGGFLLLLLLQAYYPLRYRPGAVLALLMLTYPVERFLEEMLRSDNPPLSWGLTFSQNVSLYLFLAGVVFAVWLWYAPRPTPRPAVS